MALLADNEAREIMSHLDFAWKHKWRYRIDEKTQDMVSKTTHPLMAVVGDIVERIGLDEKMSKDVGVKLAAHTHMSFVAGLEFGNMVGPSLAKDINHISTNPALKSAYETVTTGEPLLKYLAASYLVVLLKSLGDEEMRSSEKKIIDTLMITLLEVFKSGVLVSSYY